MQIFRLLSRSHKGCIFQNQEFASGIKKIESNKLEYKLYNFKINRLLSARMNGSNQNVIAICCFFSLGPIPAFFCSCANWLAQSSQTKWHSGDLCHAPAVSVHDTRLAHTYGNNVQGTSGMAKCNPFWAGRGSSGYVFRASFARLSRTFRSKS